MGGYVEGDLINGASPARNACSKCGTHINNGVIYRIGWQTAGIDPASGRIWFGASARDTVAQLETEESPPTFYFIWG